MFANWSNIKGYLLVVSGHCGEGDMDLLSDREEMITSDSLELEFQGTGVGRNSKLFDYSGMYKIAHHS